MGNDLHFINGVINYFKRFDNGDVLVNHNIKWDEFVESMKPLVDENGWVRVTSRMKKEPVEGKPNGYMVKNDYVPKPKQDWGAPAREALGINESQERTDSVSLDEIPF